MSEARLDIAAMLEAFDKVTSPAEAMLALVRPEERRIVRCCALARRFNEAMVDEILRPFAGPVAASVSFKQIVSLPGVGPVPGRPGWFRLEGGDRATHEQAWLAVPATKHPDDDLLGERAFRDINARLADWFAALGADGELESLYHRLAADGGADAQAFHAAYAAAARAFDLARCESLLEILDQRARFLDPKLATFRTDARGLLRARNAVADDYFRSARYLERASILTGFESMLRDKSKFILHLHGTGGRGKTMFLRWLGSRYCLEHEIPVARVDFDFLDANEAGLAPRFFFGKLADRLNLQLRGAPFTELVDAIIQMRRSASNRRPRSGSVMSGDDPDAEEEILSRFAYVLEENCRGPVLLVFDTLEDAGLKHRIDVRGIVSAVETVREKVAARAAQFRRPPPRVVLVLSGRYPLNEQYPEVDGAYHDSVQSQAVTPLDDLESRAYLTMIRQLPESKLLDVIVRRAGGNPFNLSLFADVVQANPDVDVRDLDRSGSVELLYLVERILKRIPDYRVRWVLRYGVAARQLTRDSLERVLGPHLARAMKGDKRYDDPAIDKVDDAGWPHLWQVQERASRLGKPDFDEIWKQLQQYASASSWVTFEGQEGKVLALQPAVTHPMRQALRGKEVVRRIHEDALRVLGRRIRGVHSPNDLAALTYHEFQLFGAKAAANWERRIEQDVWDAETQTALASVVLSEDLRESEGFDPDRKGVSLVTPRIEARAYFVLARVATSAAHEAAGENQQGLLDEARARLQSFDAVASSKNKRMGRIVPLVEEASLRWELAASSTEQDAALAQLQKAEKSKLSRDDRVTLLHTLEKAFATRDPMRAESYAAKLASIALQQRDAEAFAEATRSRLDYMAQRGAYAEALRACRAAEEALGPGRRGWQSRTYVRRERMSLRRALIGLESESGRAAAALARDDLGGPSKIDREDPWRIVNRVYLMLTVQDPMRAAVEGQEAARALEARLRTKQSEAQVRRTQLWRVMCLNNQAHALRMLASFEQSLELFQTAMVLAGEIGDEEREASLRLAIARVYLFDVGDLKQAAQHLGVGGLDQFRADAPRIERLLLRASLEELQGEAKRAASTMSEVERALAANPPLSLRQRINCALQALTVRSAARRVAWLESLRDSFKRLDHPLARLARTYVLRHADPIADAPPALVQEIVAMVTPSQRDLSATPVNPHDLLAFYLARIELLRVLGLHGRAVQEVRVLSPVLNRVRVALQDRDVARLCDRLSVSPDAVLPASWLEALQKQFARHPIVVSIVMLEAAERALAGGDAKAAATFAARSRLEAKKVRTIRSTHDVQLLSLEAKLARAGGRDAQAKDLEASAEGIRVELGQRQETPSLSERDLRRDPIPLAGWSPVDGERILIEIRSAEHTAVSQPGTGPRPVLVGTTGKELRRILNRVSERPLSGGASLALVEALSRKDSLTALAQAIARDLLPGLLPGHLHKAFERRLRDTDLMARSGGVDVTIRCREHALNAVPWEILAIEADGLCPLSLEVGVRHVSRGGMDPESTITWAQRVLNRVSSREIFADGLLGPQTRDAIKRIQFSAKLEGTGGLDRATCSALRALWRARPEAPSLSKAVLLVQSEARHEVVQQRGFASHGVHLADIYRDRGFAVDIFNEPDPQSLREQMSGRDYQVLHLAVPVAESRSADELFLQLGADAAHMRSATVLGPSLLGTLLKSIATRAPLPTVVLDVPQPPSITEAIRQLVLRNVFAAQLFTFGALPSILATGLIAPQFQRQLSHRLIQGLADRLSPGDLATCVRTNDLPDFDPWLPEHMIGTAAVALFAQDPDLDPADLFFPEAG
jgi:hypothetical protein